MRETKNVSPPRVLVVDDDPAMLLLARAALEREGYMVLEAESGPKALSMLAAESPDIVLLDVVMPGMDGFEVCRGLRKMAGKETTPVLMMTGLDDTDSIQRAYDVGATDFIMKPINWLILGHHVQYILRASRAFDALYKSEARSKALLGAIPDGMVRIARDGQILEFRGTEGRQLFAFDGAAERVNVYEVLPTHVVQQMMHCVRQALTTGEGQVFEYLRESESGVSEWEMRVVKSGEEEVLAVIRDITERKRTERDLRTSEERYALASEAANDGLWDWDIATGHVHFSSRWKTLLGYGEDEIGDDMDEWFRRVHEGDLERLKLDLDAHLKGVTAHFENEHRVLHRDGAYRWILSRGMAVRGADGRAYRMVGSQSDVSGRKRAEEQLLRNAFYDVLTGLPNRALFMDRLGHALKRVHMGRGEHACAVLFLDLDRFKVVNDSLGHMAGDALLIEVARRLERCIRPEDTVARLGGDEFVMLFEEVRDVERAKSIAERVQKALAQPYVLDGHEIFCTASIGIAMSSPEYNEPDEMLRDADITMYRAKTQGKARFEIFDESMRTAAVTLLHMESDLRRALEKEEFTVCYQPVVSLKSDTVTSLEALIRWDHPLRGLIPPADFIPLAEETGLIIPIGKWVLRTVCTQLAAWLREGASPVRVAVNISPVQLRQPDFAEMVIEILRTTGLKPEYLDLEITESVLMEHNQSMRDTLHRLKGHGVHICLDDFGTGYSALNYLQTLPIDVLKIDRSFITRLLQDAEQAKIIETILILGRSLNIEVIAEGVETEEQLAQLKLLKCENGQGYLFFKPLDSGRVRSVIALEQLVSMM